MVALGSKPTHAANVRSTSIPDLTSANEKCGARFPRGDRQSSPGISREASP